MANEQNLTPYTSETAAIGGRKGGAMRTDAQLWKTQRYCNNHCVYYDRCPGITSSLSLTPVVKGHTKKHPCFFKQQSKEVQNYFINLYQMGEAGIISAILEFGFRLMIETRKKDSPKALQNMVEVLLAMKKGIYGDKSKVELEGHIKIIEAPELRKILKEVDASRSNPDLEPA